MQYKYLRVVANEGRCEKCGTVCPKRRVEVLPVDESGAANGDVRLWGVNCAAFARYGSKSRKHQDLVLSGIRVERERRAFNDRARLKRVAVHGQADVIDAVFVECGKGDSNHPESLANRLYRRTGRPVVGSYFAKGSDGQVVRVDGGDDEDVQFFASLGYVQVTQRVKQ